MKSLKEISQEIEQLHRSLVRTSELVEYKVGRKCLDLRRAQENMLGAVLSINEERLRLLEDRNKQ